MGDWLLFKNKGMCFHSYLIKCFHPHLQTKISAQVVVFVLSHGLYSEHFIRLKIVLEDMEKANVDKSKILEKYGRENNQINLLPEEELFCVLENNCCWTSWPCVALLLNSDSLQLGTIFLVEYIIPCLLRFFH